MSMNIEELKRNDEAPNWLSEESLKILEAGYMLPGETPRKMWERVSKAAASYYSDSDYWFQKFFNAFWNNWLCGASPVLSNLGTNRGLPISCDGMTVGDSVDNIFKKNHELAILSKNGAGVSIYLGKIRGRGTPIKGIGSSDGVIPWCRTFDTTTHAISQGNVRRGATALYLPIDHKDVDEFMIIRRASGDMNRRCLNVNNAVCITDKWMEEMIGGDTEKQKKWEELLKSRDELGEPYIFFTDAVNRDNPQCYKDNGLEVNGSNLCSEICLFSDETHTFVCCLSSLNLVKWDEWKNTDLVQTAIRFLDAVMSEYIEKSENVEGLECARRFAIKSRALGLGVLGWHTLLQERILPFDSVDTFQLNAEIFRTIRKKAEEETKRMAEELGEPEWCKGYNRRHTHLLAIAPTVSNSAISGGHSPGIEPIPANIYSVPSAKGTFIRHNPTFKKLLKSKNKDTLEVWDDINAHQGSVQHLEWLSEHEKQVFLTAREVNQHILIKQAAQRQRWIDQSQSLNLFFSKNSEEKYIHDVHVEAWKQGLKTLYYLRSEGTTRGDLASRSSDECSACEA